jgi:hypothetical protein
MVSKHGCAHRRQTSLTQAYKDLFCDTSAPIPPVTTLRSSLCIFVYNEFVFSLLVLLTAHRRFLSE